MSTYGFTGHSISPHQPITPYISAEYQLKEAQQRELDIVTANILRSLEEGNIKLAGHYGDPQFIQNQNNQGIIIEAPDLRLYHVGVDTKNRAGQYTGDIKPLFNDPPIKRYVLKKIERTHYPYVKGSGIPWQHPVLPNDLGRESGVVYILEEVLDTHTGKNTFRLNVTHAIESNHNTGHFGTLLDKTKLPFAGDAAHQAKDALKGIWNAFSEGKLTKLFK
ncbi:MAG: hypothetical protein ACK5T0_09735 [Vampirovibrionales bacterium]